MVRVWEMVLYLLEEGGELRPVDVARRLGKGLSAIQGALKMLVNQGRARRRPAEFGHQVWYSAATPGLPEAREGPQ